MREITTKFGENAGKIWSILNQKGCMNKEEILDDTQLCEFEFHLGIGWLARENKIAKNNECFKLDQTNLMSEIGINAGKIWKVLDIWGDSDFITIKRLTDLDDDNIHEALGWLARENKISINQDHKFELL